MLTVDMSNWTSGDLSSKDTPAGVSNLSSSDFTSEGDPVGSQYFQADPVGDIEKSVSISPNNILDIMSGLGFSRKRKTSVTNNKFLLNDHGTNRI